MAGSLEQALKSSAEAERKIDIEGMEERMKTLMKLGYVDRGTSAKQR